MSTSLQFCFSLVAIGTTLVVHSGLTAVVIERSKSGWCRVLSATLLLANGVWVLAVLGRVL